MIERLLYVECFLLGVLVTLVFVYVMASIHGG
jgi:hypothetical protein